MKVGDGEVRRRRELDAGDEGVVQGEDDLHSLRGGSEPPVHEGDEAATSYRLRVVGVEGEAG